MAPKPPNVRRAPAEPWRSSGVVNVVQGPEMAPSIRRAPAQPVALLYVPMAACMHLVPGMRNLWIAIAVVGVCATGCGALSRTETTYTKPGTADGQLAADRNACRQQSIGQADKKSMPTWGQTINREAFDDCMRARGYDVDTASASPRW